VTTNRTVDINGYTVETKFATNGSGRSQWAFASRNGRSLFIKRFLMPTYPADGTRDSATNRAKRARCEAFEARHQAVDQVLAEPGPLSDHLVVAEDFFRWGAHYYKVTRRVDGVPVAEVCDAWLSPDAVLQIATGIAAGLAFLHGRNLVHGDISPDNVLVTRLQDGRLVSTVIDIDECFATGSPPPPAEHSAHLAYLAPETARYLTGDGPASEVTTKADVYSMGLILAELVERLGPHSVHPDRRLVETLLAPDPRDRPEARHILYFSCKAR
jgi:eukaryotic-like serine/threonine-protein kinase